MILPGDRPGHSQEENSGLAEGSCVSVVIPAFNRAHLIERTLDSVKDQSHRPIEIIVVDDGSSDNSIEVVESWAGRHADERLGVTCVSQQNQGANPARNRGIATSGSDFIAFLDSDDRWLPDKLQAQLQSLAEDPRLGGVYCGLRSFDLDTGMHLPTPNRDYPQGNLLADMLVRDVTNPTSCWLVRRTCFDTVGTFDETLPARQDWDMWIRLSSEFHIGAVPEPLVEMGEHHGARIRSDPAREISAHKIIFNKYAPLRARFPFWVSLAARSAMYRRRGRVYLHRKGLRLRAISMQLLAILVWPFCFDSYAALLGALVPSRLRSRLNLLWNRVFGKTVLRIRSH